MNLRIIPSNSNKNNKVALAKAFGNLGLYMLKKLISEGHEVFVVARVFIKIFKKVRSLYLYINH